MEGNGGLEDGMEWRGWRGWTTSNCDYNGGSSLNPGDDYMPLATVYPSIHPIL